MSDYDEPVFQRLGHLRNRKQTVAQQTEFLDLGFSTDEQVYSLRRLQSKGFCYVLPYPQYAMRDFQTFSVEIYFDAVNEFLGGGQ